jgi:hypothetical protein
MEIPNVHEGKALTSDEYDETIVNEFLEGRKEVGLSYQPKSPLVECLEHERKRLTEWTAFTTDES